MKESLSLFETSFVTLRVPLFEGCARHYLKEPVAAQVPMEILTRHLLHQKTGGRETENVITSKIAGTADKLLDALAPAWVLRNLT